MKYQKVTAIVRSDAIAHVEQRLHDVGVPGLSISKVKGYGEYADFYTDDWLVSHVRLEVYVDESNSNTIVQTIMDAAGSSAAGDGIIAITPVVNFYRIRDHKEIVADLVTNS